MEYVNCILCNSKEHFNTIELVRDRFNPNEEYRIQECRCGMVLTNPRPDLKEISKHYQNQNYHPKNRINKVVSFFYRVAQIFNNRSKRKLIQKYFNKGYFLDYGGGNGQFQRYMSKNNWKADIYEPYLKVDGNEKKIKTIKDNYYDAISMFHSLEHVHDSEKALKDIDRALKQKGILVISVPNHDAFERSIFKKKWIAYDAPRHLYHFTIKSIEEILNKNGFKVIEYKPVYIDTIYNILMSFDSKISYIFRAPFLILNSLVQIYMNKNKASSIMFVCNKDEN